MTTDAPPFRRRALVSRWARRRLETLDHARREADVAAFADLDLSRTFTVTLRADGGAAAGSEAR